MEAGRFPLSGLSGVEARVTLQAVLVPERPTHLAGFLEAAHDVPEGVLGSECLDARAAGEADSAMAVDAAEGSGCAGLERNDAVRSCQ